MKSPEKQKVRTVKVVTPVTVNCACPVCGSDDVVGPDGSFLIQVDEIISLSLDKPALTCQGCGATLRLPKVIPSRRIG